VINTWSSQRVIWRWCTSSSIGNRCGFRSGKIAMIDGMFLVGYKFVCPLSNHLTFIALLFLESFVSTSIIKSDELSLKYMMMYYS
jgi:hypothetical protein